MAKKWNPEWWTDEEHGSAWERVKGALKRDWEQTKHDLHMGGADIDQDVGDTVSEAVGKTNKPNIGKRERWEDIEEPMRLGVGARSKYGAGSDDWSTDVENKLREDWKKSGDKREWDDVKPYVQTAYRYPI